MVFPINKINKFEVEGVNISKMTACVPCWISIAEEYIFFWNFVILHKNKSLLLGLSILTLSTILIFEYSVVFC
jgi:hypothetical protein